MRILIADDEPLARARLRWLVDDLDAGSVVAEASDGAEALALTESCRPDLLLLDIRMPRMDGLEVARHLTKLSEPPAVVFTTAYDAHALAAIEACAVAYLLKPIRKNRLEVALEGAHSHPRPAGGTRRRDGGDQPGALQLECHPQRSTPPSADRRGALLPGRAQVCDRAPP